MANIGVRSPYFISDSDTDVAYGTLALTIGGTLRYTITKDVIPGTNTVTIDISQLVRDYIQPEYFSGFTEADTGRVPVSYQFNLFTADGTPSAKNPISDVHVAYDAYGYYYDGNNYELPSSSSLVTGGEIWVPLGQSGFAYEDLLDFPTKIPFNGTATSVESITINRYPCSRYENYALVFINRFGVHQQMWFTAKTVTSQGFTGARYKSKYNANDGSLNANKHQVVDFNRNGKKRYVLNTDYISTGESALNAHFQELLQSEYVWLEDQELNTSIPVNVTTSSISYKTGLNDRLVNYQVQVEQAFDIISTAR